MKRTDMITAILDSHGKLTGKYQSGDHSKHPNFDPSRYRVMFKSEFDKAVAKHNDDARAAMVIPLSEVYPKGVENSLCGTGQAADNFWK